jgi:hypothetical protein
MQTDRVPCKLDDSRRQLRSEVLGHVVKRIKRFDCYH